MTREHRKLTKLLVVRVDERLYRVLEEDAERNGRTISQTVRHKLRELTAVAQRGEP